MMTKCIGSGEKKVPFIYPLSFKDIPGYTPVPNWAEGFSPVPAPQEGDCFDTRSVSYPY